MRLTDDRYLSPPPKEIYNSLSVAATIEGRSETLKPPSWANLKRLTIETDESGFLLTITISVVLVRESTELQKVRSLVDDKALIQLRHILLMA